ncbi:4'-phosphopantetheinyl transferase family protein [Mycobacterium montefiorense]|uniref:4'-phosphopantetheinyl transferase family protein n=1 Tax=Mycobacterium montefiorense TaxID=154654 RepID=UPI0021F30916|nr:4'-phosphopantetheinyl transferase superfamily protein [Mycobacterium montefiorense]
MINETPSLQGRDYLSEITNGVFVARAVITQWTAEPVSYRAMAGLLDCDYPRWRNARSDRFRARFAATRYFAKAMVASVAEIGIEDIELRRGAFGRPEFCAPRLASLCGARPYRVVDANLSHTGDTVVMAISTRGRVGVDVESSHRNLDHGGFAEAICHPDELSEYLDLSRRDRQRMLLRLWTWKEATTKAMGTGLSTPFPSLHVEFARGVVADSRGQQWRVHDMADAGHQVAIATEVK